jgi:AcrR family transcriptional regulator
MPKAKPRRSAPKPKRAGKSAPTAKASKGGPAPARPTRDAKPATVARRAELLETALALVAEHGVDGASLRRLAQELGISQPSLYHYFPSKDALIREIVEYCAQQMVNAGLGLKPPARLEDLPRFAKDAVLALYSTETHPRFVRFLFVVAIERAENRALIERVFAERFDASFSALAGWFAKSPEQQAELEQMLHLVVYGIGFALLEERVIFGKSRPSPKTLRYAEWVVSACERLLAGPESGP